MRREFARRMRTLADRVPSRVGSALLIGAWVALSATFAFVGNVVVLRVVTAMGPSLEVASLLVTVFGIFSTPAISLVLARRVVAGAVVRFDYLVRRHGADADRFDLVRCETDDRGRCRTATCC
jgi:hypothetical protein